MTPPAGSKGGGAGSHTEHATPPRPDQAPGGRVYRARQSATGNTRPRHGETPAGSAVCARRRVGSMVLARNKVLLLAADDFEDMELLYPLYRLREEDAAVTVAGLDDHAVTGK